MNGKTSGWQDSLLNQRQFRYASEALTNLRVSCCGGTQILPKILDKHWAETLDMCRSIHNLDDIKTQIVNNFIYRSQSGQLSSCHNCGIQLQTLFVVPCGHLVCTECIDKNTRICPCCLACFDVDEFQRLQPGLDNQFCLNIKEEQRERERSHALKQALTDSTRPRDAIAQARRTHKKGESCVYSIGGDGKCTICREEHFDCNFMNSSNQQCSICFKFAEECPEYASKAKYIINKVRTGVDRTSWFSLIWRRKRHSRGRRRFVGRATPDYGAIRDGIFRDHNCIINDHSYPYRPLPPFQLMQLRSNEFSDSSERCTTSPMAARLFANGRNKNAKHRPLKAILFSQFRTSYEYVGDRLIRRFGVRFLSMCIE